MEVVHLHRTSKHPRTFQETHAAWDTECSGDKIQGAFLEDSGHGVERGLMVPVMLFGGPDAPHAWIRVRDHRNKVFKVQ